MKTKQTLSPEAVSLIMTLLKDESSAYKIQYQLRNQLKEKVSRKIIDSFKAENFEEKKDAPIKHSAKTKKVFKHTGSTIINEFLERAKEGEDVSSIQAVLEHAVYVDSLRRYVAQDEGLESLDIKDVIKITNDYRRLQINSAKASINQNDNEKLSATLAVKLIELVESIFSCNKKLLEEFKNARPSLIKKIKMLVSQDDIPEIEILQKLNEKARGVSSK